MLRGAMSSRGESDETPLLGVRRRDAGAGAAPGREPAAARAAHHLPRRAEHDGEGAPQPAARAGGRGRAAEAAAAAAAPRPRRRLRARARADRRRAPAVLVADVRGRRASRRRRAPRRRACTRRPARGRARRRRDEGASPLLVADAATLGSSSTRSACTRSRSRPRRGRGRRVDVVLGARRVRRGCARGGAGTGAALGAPPRVHGAAGRGRALGRALPLGRVARARAPVRRGDAGCDHWHDDAGMLHRTSASRKPSRASRRSTTSSPRTTGTTRRRGRARGGARAWWGARSSRRVVPRGRDQLVGPRRAHGAVGVHAVRPAARGPERDERCCARRGTPTPSRT